MKNSAQAISETEEARKAREVTESIARNISALAKSIAGLIGGPLNRKALLTLLSSSSGLPKTTVDAVLTALMNLEKDWLK